MRRADGEPTGELVGCLGAWIRFSMGMSAARQYSVQPATASSTVTLSGP